MADKKGIVVNQSKKLVTLYTDVANQTEVSLATGLVAQGFELITKSYPKKSRKSSSNAVHKEAWYLANMTEEQAKLFKAKKASDGFMSAVRWYRETVEPAAK